MCCTSVPTAAPVSSNFYISKLPGSHICDCRAFLLFDYPLPKKLPMSIPSPSEEEEDPVFR